MELGEIGRKGAFDGRFLCAVICAGVFIFSTPAISWGHGFAGKRFFLTTLAVDDPFVSDELSFLMSYMAICRNR